MGSVFSSSAELPAVLNKLHLAAAYDAERGILNLQGKALGGAGACELAGALAHGDVKWVLARRGFDEIGLEIATALVAALQSDACRVNHIDLRNCCPSPEALAIFVNGLTKYTLNEVELEATRIGSEKPPDGYWDLT